MEKSNSSRAQHGSTYWQLLAAADDALQVGDYPAAERRYLDACALRDTSPGRVFITEKIGDGLRRVLGRRRAGAAPTGLSGRWNRASRFFVDDFNGRGERIVREGVRLAELRPEDDAETNQPILESALFLVSRSQIFQDEPASAVPLLRGVFRAAARTGRPFNVDLVRHDLPLTEEDRLWMARKGGELVESFVEQGHLRQGSPEAAEWAEVFLQLLQARYFGGTGRLAEERAWLEALTADRLLGRAAASVELYRAYLAVNPEPGPRPDEARVRLLELLGNTHAVNFPVPRYTEALGAMQSAGLAVGSAVGGRFEEALARLEYRRPDGEKTAGQAPAWASAAVEPDGRVAVVYWWDNEPRDLAFWRAGDSAVALDEFLAPCAGRLLAADEATLAATAGQWEDEPAPWTAQEFVAAIMESVLPAAGLEPTAMLRLALAETGPWRAGWRPGLGHSLLEPPHSSTLVDAWQQGTAVGALQAGLMFLAVRSRVADADISLRAGIGEMARRGDPASRFLYGFLTLDSEADRALDASFEAWTLPLLWTRPDPFGWGNNSTAGGAPAVTEVGIRPDLGRSDLTIVTTGNAPAVLTAWGDGKQKWRVVLDRMDRLESLAQVAGGVMGPVTLIPRDGLVHSLTAALQLLEDLLVTGQPGADGLLALFHWTRLVETHNGDLLDFDQVRPRPAGVIPLYERYGKKVGGLAQDRPSLSADGSLDTDTLRTWGGQFSQRVRKAGLVAGTCAHLGTDGPTLDALWGVFEGSDAAWVFLDSAAVHWALHEQGDLGIQKLHKLLHSRGGRHLSLLSAAAWQRTELEELLATWLQVFGSAYCLSLTDTRAPTLRLVDRGVRPEATLTAADELAGTVTWIDRRFAEEGAGTVRLPGSGRAGEFWQHIRSGDLALAGQDWCFLADDSEAPGLPAAALVVPVLRSLEGEGVPRARQDARVAWAEADRERAAFLRWRRKLCALEIASLMAGHWRSVDILDTRWWRLLWPEASAAVRSRPWTGEQAAQLATNGVARTFDLPGTADPGGPTDDRVLAIVQGWLSRREGTEPGRAATGADIEAPPGGVQLLVGDLTPIWEQSSRYLATQWERGELARWMLVVADKIPAGAADLVAAGGVAGQSVWSGEQEPDLLTPVLWVGPGDFADARLRQLLNDRPPRIIVADDLADWLPGADRDGQETALALRGILDCGAQTVVLRARELDANWAGFLAGACGARLVGAVVSDGSTRSLPTASKPICVDCGGPDRPAALVRRLRVLLERMREILVTVAGEEPDSVAPPSDRQLLPVKWLARLSGMSSDEVNEGVLLLRWAARLNGDSLSAAGGEGADGLSGGHTLVIAGRYAELESILDKLGENLAVLLPLWFAGTTVPGLLGAIDLEQPPVRIGRRELALVDAFLGAVAAGTSYGCRLVYACPRGLLNSSTRLVGWDGSLQEVVPALQTALDVFRGRVRGVLDTALETGAGFRVETGLTELRAEESDFMGLGVVLGLWRWLGPPCREGLYLVDLLTVADSPTVRQSPLGWDLFMTQAAPRYPVAPADLPALQAKSKAAGPLPRLGQLRRLLSAGVEASDDLDAVVERVHTVAGSPGDPALLVLRGMVGTGRHEAMVRGLLRTLNQAADPGEVVVYCPDQAIAAMVAREFLRRGYNRPLDIRVPACGGGVPAGPNASPALARPETTVVVMCEIQRFDAETRYRVAQMGRGKLLVMTADPVASLEPWEHLFLTTPRANEIVELTEQRRLSKAIWREVRALAPADLESGGRTRRHERGHLESGYAANLVQSLARVVAARAEGTLPMTLRLTTPLAADLEFLSGQLRDRGWLAVPEAELDAVLLPGPREVLAAVTDVLALSGELALAFPAESSAGEGSGTADGGAAPEAMQAETEASGAGDPTADELMLPHLLGPGGLGEWRAWLDGFEVDAELTLAEFVGRLVGTPWANTFLRQPESRHRCEKLLARWGDQPLRSLLATSLWGAWWHLMTADLGLRPPVSQRPVVVMSDTARLPGCRVPGGAYLCLGTEPARQHYEFLGRITDSAVVLYQERSPLPGEAPGT